MVKKIIKRAFVILFSLFTLFSVILSMIDFDKSVFWNIGKFALCIFFTIGILLTIEWATQWIEERGEKKDK